MPKKKKLVPNSGKSIAEIMKGHEVTDAKGGISQAFTKNHEYFVDINCIYSQEYPEGKMLELLHIVLYCRFKSYQANEKTCYESQGRLGQLFRCDAGTIGVKIEELENMGLVKKVPHPNSRISTLIYTALDITDAHIIPPDQLSAAPESDVVRQQPEPMPAPEPVKAAEEKANVAPDWDAWDAPEYPEQPAPTMTNVIEEAVIVSQSVPESVATTTESDQAVMDVDVALEVVCERLSHSDSLIQSQRYDTFTAYARRVLRNDGKRLSRRFEERLEERFEQLHPHLYSRFEISF
ncbi:MAG TPA: hypothetical protein VJY31_09345 [Buttiauxella sp.]|nr:hypothetical protein [Buttiauxella sp.]